MIYDAFISYRHTPLDMEFAKKVHTALETYRVPASVRKKTGKKRIDRVFRDQEELPIGSNLNDNITTALRESEFLIVICSPETPGSYWVAKEIETFIALHDRQHVLVVLVDGEPDQSFPPLLLTDESGRPIEPLAADVRGATPKERNRKFKSELLRLAAPLLGCTYDDLRQRHRERILRRNIMIGAVAAGVIAVAGAAFGIYNARVADRMKKLADEKAVLAEEKSVLADDKSKLADEKTKLADEMTVLADEKTKLADKILVEYREKQENQSRFYAEQAMLLLEEGNREDAVLIAAAALPSEDNARPYVAEAEYALSAALHAYDSGTQLAYDRLLHHDYIVRDTELDKNARYLTSVDRGNTVYVWDCKSWELLLKIPPTVSDNNYLSKVIAAMADENGLVIVNGTYVVRYDFSGRETARYDFDRVITGCRFGADIDTVFCCSDNTLWVISLQDLAPRTVIRNDAKDFSSLTNCLSPDGKWFAQTHHTPDGGPARVTVVDLTSLSYVTTAVSEQYILNMTITDSGNVAVVSTNSEFYAHMDALTLDLVRAVDGEVLYSKAVPRSIWDLAGFSLLVTSHSYADRSDIIIVADVDAYSVDEQSGEVVAHFSLNGLAVSLAPVPSSSTMFVACRNGDIMTVSTENGRVFTDRTISTNEYTEDMKLLNSGVVLRRLSSDCLAVMKYHKAEGITEAPKLPSDCFGLGTAPSGEYYVLDDRYSLGTYYFCDRNGDIIYTVQEESSTIATGFFGDLFVIAWYDHFSIIDPVNGTARQITYKDTGADPSYLGGCLGNGGRLLALRGTYGLAVIDLGEERCIYLDKEFRSVGLIALSGDGSKILIMRNGEPLIIRDIVTGETTAPAEKEAYRQVSDCNILTYVVCDASGQYAAMACADGNVRIFEIASGATVRTIPLMVQSVCFIGFSADAKRIILQGDDFLVKVYDIADGTCINRFDAPASIEYLVEDGDIIALCDNVTVSLLNAESFGRLAYVPEAVVYLAKDRKFVRVNNGRMWLVPYKDYKELLLEAERQFPGAELSEEKKVSYNIE